MSRAESLSNEDTRALRAVLDEIIPPSGDGRLPGAGELGLVSCIEEAMVRSPDLRPAVEQGLTALRARAEELGGPFETLEPSVRRDALNEVAARQPAFLPGLIFHVFTGYYQEGRVLEGLGLEPRPPHPQGYPLEAGDLSLLDPVRERGRRYREV
jgi:hypothetical protein